MFKLRLKAVYLFIRNRITELYIRFTMRPSKLNAAIRKAKKKHKKTGLRYRVFYFGYKYHAWNRRDIRRQQNSGIFKDGLKTGIDFDKICFFDTQNPDLYVSKRK